MRVFGTFMWVGVVALALSNAHAAAPSGAQERLDRARQHVEALRYGQAERELDEAMATRGNSRQVLLQILELQGVVAAGRGKTSEARDYFEKLLVLEPKFAPASEYSPRVMTPFDEARSLVTAHGAMQLRPVRVPGSGPGAYTLKVVLVDPLNLGMTVRFHARRDGGDWEKHEAPVEHFRAATLVQADHIEWWAELLGAKDEVLITLRDAEHPLVQTEDVPTRASQSMARPAPQTRNLEPAEKPVPSPDAVSGALPTAQTEHGVFPFRPLAYGLLGGGVGATAAGVYFLLQASGARREIEQAARDVDGRIIGITQARAFELDAQAKRNNTLGTGLLIGAGALVVGGATLWILDGRLGPAPGGVGISGKLP